MEEVRVHEFLGLQVIVIPEGYRLAVQTVFLTREGIALLVIPANEEGEELVHQRRLDALSDDDDNDDAQEG
jgi:virulence-associated protein VagC